MSDYNNALWRNVSMGFAGENLTLGSKYLEVFMPETSGFSDGEITSHVATVTTSGVDNRGNSYQCEIKTTNTIKARWRSNIPNRITPPDIRRGERVDIWQYENTDMYYWTATGDSEDKRRLETVTYAFSNTTDEATETIDETNSYNFQISTHQGQINLNTTKSNGEPLTHHIQIDTKNGNMHYRDSNGNYIQVEGKDKRITLENGDGSQVVLDGENASLVAKQDISLDCKNLKIKADTIEAHATTTNLNSKFNILGNTNVKGNIGVMGGWSVTGDSVSTGNFNHKGKITNNGVSIGSDHRHNGVETGSGTSQPPV